MYVIIVGCGRVGSELAHRLFSKGHEVTVVDEVSASFKNLPADYRGRTVEGEVLTKEVLERAEIERADALAAVTSSDTVNAVVTHLARHIYKVPRVVARNFAPRALPLHEAFGHPVVSSTAWGAWRIEELLVHPWQEQVLSIGNGDVEINELRVSAEWNGRKAQEFLIDTGGVMVALVREGRATVPAPEEPLMTDDRVYVSAPHQAMETLRRRLQKEE
jgi:trk system potassium uptake protein TrkA